MIILSKKNIEDIQSHSEKEFPSECCGLIVNSIKENTTVPCKNVAKDKFQNYDICPRDYLYADKIGTILAAYHSHHSNHLADFSQFDIQNSELHKLPIILYISITKEIKTYYPQNYKIPYFGRQFKYGEQDCFSLIKEYFFTELGVKLDNYFPDRNSDIFIKTPNLLSKEFLCNECNKSGFSFIQYEKSIQLKRNDILVMTSTQGYKPSHFAIYLGNGTILHQPRNSLSRIELLKEYGGIICYICRYEKD